MFQTEWNVGRGPALNDAQTEVLDRPLYGGYAMTMHRLKTHCHREFWPFARWAYYKGGYKSERNAPFSRIDEFDLGLEWQFSKSLELVSMYTFRDRTNTQCAGNSECDFLRSVRRRHPSFSATGELLKTLVTGGAGFIGSHIATGLVERGDSVRVLDNFDTGKRANLAHLGGEVELIEGSVVDPGIVAEAVKGVDVVFHQAALASVPRSVNAPLDTNAVCVTGTVNVLDAAQGGGPPRGLCRFQQRLRQ